MENTLRELLEDALLAAKNLDHAILTQDQQADLNLVIDRLVSALLRVASLPKDEK